MAWRLLMRRCPSRSMTVVGDVAQTGALGRRAVLGGRARPRTSRSGWRLTELTVNYRTPAEIMAVAADVLAEIDPALRPPRSVRESGVPPWDRGGARRAVGGGAGRRGRPRGGRADRRAARRDRAGRPGGASWARP